MNQRAGVAAVAGLLLAGTAAGCGTSAGATPGSTSAGVVCPSAGPVKASDLAQLAPCDLTGMEITMDVWKSEQMTGTVQNVGECSDAAEGTPVVVCTYPAPTGTGGYVGDGNSRVWFGTETAVKQVKDQSN